MILSECDNNILFSHAHTQTHTNAHAHTLVGGDSAVYTWDLRMRRCLSQLSDHGNVSPSSLTVSEDGRFFATGSESGVVNVYKRGAETGRLVHKGRVWECAYMCRPLLCHGLCGNVYF